MGYKDRFKPKGEYGNQAPTIPRGARLIPVTETTARCSVCKRVFGAKGNDPTSDMQRQFATHNCNPSEDANQAAARIVRETTKNH
jgi:nitrate reductase cytochrome c-type subunit